MYKSLVGPNQRRYQALGLPEIFKTQDSSTFSPPSPQAPLQLNRAKGKGVHHTLQTPSRVEETSFERSGEELAKPPPNRQMLSAFLSQNYHDALAEAIEETKSFEHLVSATIPALLSTRLIMGTSHWTWKRMKIQADQAVQLVRILTLRGRDRGSSARCQTSSLEILFKTTFNACKSTTAKVAPTIQMPALSRSSKRC